MIILVNGEVVRVNSLQGLIGDSYHIDISWESEEVEEGEEEVGVEDDQKNQEKIQKIVEEKLKEEDQNLNYSIIPTDHQILRLKISQTVQGTSFCSLSSTISFFSKIIEEIKNQKNEKIECFISLMNLEKEFVGYSCK